MRVFHINFSWLFFTGVWMTTNLLKSLSAQSLHLQFCCVLSILSLIWLVLMALFCAAITRDSVSPIKFPFLSHIHVFSCEMLFISRLKGPLCCFSSHFFLVVVILLSILSSVSFLVAVISPPFVFSNVVFESLYRCVTLSSTMAISLPPFFIDTYTCQRRLCDVMPYVWSYIFFFIGLFA